MERFTAYDLQRHIGKVQDAASLSPIAITHHGTDRYVLMDFARWKNLGRGDALADAVKKLQSHRGQLYREGIATISLFGSVARGEARADSGIDLLIEPASGVSVSGLKLMHWKALLTEILGRPADVVVREFLDRKVLDSMTLDLVEALVTRDGDAGHAA